ncbi:MAG: hypothetical protein NVV68_06780 [Dokdonella sp.]|nr:hypothetical protein [Dokdonella sp.]
MSNDWIKDSMADFHTAFLDAGMANVATYVPQSGSPVPSCRVFVDRDITTAALAGVELIAGQAMVRLLIEPAITSLPRNGDEIRVGVESFTIVRRVRTDEASWVFVCQA